MGVTFMQRRPDSGLGNVRSSPGDPSRNIDWVLLLTQAALAVIGCFIVFSASRTRIVEDPYAFVTRQVVFGIIAAVVMFAVMSANTSAEGAGDVLYGLTLVSCRGWSASGVHDRNASVRLGAFNFARRDGEFRPAGARRYLAESRDEVDTRGSLGGRCSSARPRCS